MGGDESGHVVDVYGVAKVLDLLVEEELRVRRAWRMEEDAYSFNCSEIET